MGGKEAGDSTCNIVAKPPGWVSIIQGVPKMTVDPGVLPVVSVIVHLCRYLEKARQDSEQIQGMHVLLALTVLATWLFTCMSLAPVLWDYSLPDVEANW